ncbi:hypothetical protein NXC14_PA00123 (plasmid) [Rhizobium sp. NXC14]|nr:hypothetical protein NXC14_PA00123 [Rhizobium sp. NXC14]
MWSGTAGLPAPTRSASWRDCGHCGAISSIRRSPPRSNRTSIRRRIFRRRFITEVRMARVQMSEIEPIARTIVELATADMTPKQLIKAVRARHKDASKRDITGAPFYGVIMASEQSPERSK